MEKVELATMLPGASKVDDQNLNPTWKSHVYTENGLKTAFVKIVEPRKIFVECACALIGRNLGLSIPSPMIINITHDALPELVPQGTTKLAFGSEDAKHPSFRRRMNKDSAEAMALLQKYSKLLEVSIFDEWIANHDRNIGNILFDGRNNFVFIDHELALPLIMKPNYYADDNQFLRAFYSGVSEFEKHKASKEVKTRFIPQYTAIDLESILTHCVPEIYYDRDSGNDILKILSDRIEELTSLSSQRMNISQQELAI